ncbi:MAG TPA: DNA recombination protein RmuC [Terracidiphilus sp.]|nr:DNA recombination protein RmuC [Terracidiphilus sp.]
MPIWIVGVIAGVAGILAGYWLRNASARAHSAVSEALAAEREKRAVELTGEVDALRASVAAKADEASRLAATVAELNAKLENEQKNMAEKVALLETAKKALADQFQTLAGEILDQKSKSFSEGSQKEIGNILGPLKTQIEDFRKKVEEAQSDSKTGVARLEGLIGNLGSVNQQLAAEAKNLSSALRGSAKAQGDWGEFILRDLLEKAGLREGEQYSFQQSFTGIESEDGGKARSARTDVVILLPGGRNLVIDSKVSLTAYTDYANAAADGERGAALKLHLASVRGHVTGLARAGYQKLPGLESPDFVVMFVPVEPAFLLALQNDAELWADAYQQGILLVGPTTLLYIIRIVNVLWQQEVQARSVRDVMTRGAELYDKFANFVSDLEAVGKSLRAADLSYSTAMKKLCEGRGNLIRQVEMLKELGIRTSKSLPRNLLDASAGAESELALAADGEADEKVDA